MANGPVDDDAHTTLNESNVAVIPDIVANAGGVIVSYFEWQQNLSHQKWSEKKVRAKLDTILTKATNDMIQTANEHQISLKEAAFHIALKRLSSKD